VGTSINGAIVAAYRLASRSFPHRKIKFDANSKIAHVVSLLGQETEVLRNSLLTYPCLQVVNKISVLIANGSHLKNIYEKMIVGLPPVKAITQVLSELGPENDVYKTPRIVGLASKKKHVLGIISNRNLIVRSFPFKSGLAYYVATYRKIDPSKNCLMDFDAINARETAEAVHERYIFKTFTHSLYTIASFIENDLLEISIYPS
jgi:IMP cyclohydrolase